MLRLKDLKKTATYETNAQALLAADHDDQVKEIKAEEKDAAEAKAATRSVIDAGVSKVKREPEPVVDADLEPVSQTGVDMAGFDAELLQEKRKELVATQEAIAMVEETASLSQEERDAARVKAGERIAALKEVIADQEARLDQYSINLEEYVSKIKSGEVEQQDSATAETILRDAEAVVGALMEPRSANIPKEEPAGAEPLPAAAEGLSDDDVILASVQSQLNAEKESDLAQADQPQSGEEAENAPVASPEAEAPHPAEAQATADDEAAKKERAEKLAAAAAPAQEQPQDQAAQTLPGIPANIEAYHETASEHMERVMQGAPETFNGISDASDEDFDAQEQAEMRFRQEEERKENTVSDEFPWLRRPKDWPSFIRFPSEKDLIALRVENASKLDEMKKLEEAILDIAEKLKSGAVEEEKREAAAAYLARSQKSLADKRRQYEEWPDQVNARFSQYSDLMRARAKQIDKWLKREYDAVNRWDLGSYGNFMRGFGNLRHKATHRVTPQKVERAVRHLTKTPTEAHMRNSEEDRAALDAAGHTDPHKHIKWALLLDPHLRPDDPKFKPIARFGHDVLRTRDGATLVAKGDELFVARFSNPTKQAAMLLIREAIERGWDQINITGTREFCQFAEDLLTGNVDGFVVDRTIRAKIQTRDGIGAPRPRFITAAPPALHSAGSTDAEKARAANEELLGHKGGTSALPTGENPELLDNPLDPGNGDHQENRAEAEAENETSLEHS